MSVSQILQALTAVPNQTALQLAQGLISPEAVAKDINPTLYKLQATHQLKKEEGFPPRWGLNPVASEVLKFLMFHPGSSPEEVAVGVLGGTAKKGDINPVLYGLEKAGLTRHEVDGEGKKPKWWRSE